MTEGNNVQAADRPSINATDANNEEMKGSGNQLETS